MNKRNIIALTILVILVLALLGAANGQFGSLPERLGISRPEAGPAVPSPSQKMADSWEVRGRAITNAYKKRGQRLSPGGIPLDKYGQPCQNGPSGCIPANLDVPPMR